jgi:hypothetical protein
MSSEPRPRPRAWSTVNFPMAGFFWFVGLLWLALFGVDLAITAGIAIWGEIDRSVWEEAGGIVRFFAAGVVGWLVYRYLPVYVAHGVTRREFMKKLTVFTVVLSALLGALAALGFALERLVFSVADWPQELTDEHVFDSATELPTILLAFWLAFLVWTAVGAIIGAAIYRQDDGWGLLALPVCLVLLIPAGFATGTTDLSFLDRLFVDAVDEPTDSLVLVVAACLASAAAGLSFAWALIREMPIRRTVT